MSLIQTHMGTILEHVSTSEFYLVYTNSKGEVLMAADLEFKTYTMCSNWILIA